MKETAYSHVLQVRRFCRRKQIEQFWTFIHVMNNTSH